jgi:DNA-directed RNA polymerase II subunit RPB1
MNRRDLHYNSDVAAVKAVQFGIKSPEQIEKEAVIEIFTHETFDGDVPKRGGLFDPHMGVLENGAICPTDQNDNRKCPGYFGFIRLARPVYHYQFISWVIKTLKNICIRCSNLYVDIQKPEIRERLKHLKGIQRFHYISKLTSDTCKMCRECGATIPSNIKKEASNNLCNLVAEWKKTTQKPKSQISLTVLDVQSKLTRISDEEAEAMGYSRQWCRPEWLICTVLPVAPPTVRPSVQADNNTRSEDDITHKYFDILKTNRSLRQKLENTTNPTPAHIIDDWANLLQYHVATLVDNTIPGIPQAQQRSGRALKSIKERLKSKEGRVRGNLMGKRVDFSARTVITPDPNIELDQLGVPIKIAKHLTRPIAVNQFNIDLLTKLVRNGPDIWPGAKTYRKKKNGITVYLKHVNRENINLEYGDVVNRHLMNEDVVLFNRQPSLHRMSMMCHRVRVMRENTFRLNLSVTGPYNADFDGDEMNMHVPQSIQTSVELKELAGVETQIIGPGQNRPVISLVQDTIIGSSLFTSYNTFMTHDAIKKMLIWIREYGDEFAQMDTEWNTLPFLTKDQPLDGDGGVLSICPNFPITHEAVERNSGGFKLREDLWSGRQFVNLIVPRIYLVKKNMQFDDLPESRKHEGKIQIENGEYKEGRFDKNILGAKSQGIIHVIFNDLGPQKAKQFLDDMQNIVTNWLATYGFSVGISDLIANEHATKAMHDIITQKKKNVVEIIQHVHKGILKNDTGKPDSDEFELQVNKNLNAAVSEAGKKGIRELSSDNRMTGLINSGSKGSIINIGQMIACLGQQNVDGKRIQNGFTGRTMPHFHKYDDGVSSRGFVENSFISGLTPTEFYMHAMGGREGLIDTAIKTSETGYIQRRLVKAMEEMAIRTDMTIRDANGNIIQFLYGEDGMESTKIEKQHLNTICMNYKDITSNYRFSITEPFEEYCTKDVLEAITEKVVSSQKAVLKKTIRKELELHFRQLLEDKQFMIDKVQLNNPTTEVFYPIHFDRLIKNIKNKYARNSTKTDLNPIDILSQLNTFEQTLFLTRQNTGNHLMCMLLRQKLSPKVLMKQHRFTKKAFYELVQVINTKFQESIASMGESVGVIAAQSIGEPCTQMTLNTFHFAGVGSKSTVVRGVPRIKEVINATKDIKSPVLTVYLKQEYSADKEKASKVLNSLEITTIKDIIRSSKIYWDPMNKLGEENLTNISEDQNMLEIYQEFHDYTDCTLDDLNPWVLRLEFDRREMLDKTLKMEDIYYNIDSHFNTKSQKIHCVYSDDNSTNLIFRIQCFDEDINDSKDDVSQMLKAIEKQIISLTLKGIKGIKKANMSKEENVFRKVNGRYVKKPEWVIDTDGKNLIEVLAKPEVDSSKTFSNDLHEVYQVFGVEAARELLIREISEVIEFSGSYVNYRHISLLADVMTNKGGIMPIDRHGINKSDRGPLAKCSFEETPDILAKAAIFGEVDNMRGVSASIMFGQEIEAGTGSIDLLFDEEAFFQTDKMEPEMEEQSEEFFESYCAKEKLQFNIGNMEALNEEAEDELEEGIELPMIEMDSDSDSDSE